MGFLLSSSFWFSVLASTTPVMLATLAANIVSQAGIFNLAIEGTMLICALAGVLGSAWTGNLLVGAVAGLFFGILVSFILGYFTLVMRGPMNACGVAINLAATGGTVFVLVLTAGSKITSSAAAEKQRAAARFSSSGRCFSSCDRLFCSSFLTSNIPLQALVSSPCKALTSSDKARLSVSDTGRQETA